MSQLEEWLVLNHVKQLGPATAGKLLNEFPSPEKILNAKRPQLESVGIPKTVVEGIIAAEPSSIEQDLRWLEHEDHHLITMQDPHYPKLLTQIPDPPILLYVHGKKKHVADLLSDPQLAIVGSRNASAQGKQIAKTFAEKLAQAGLVITSGLASGIDGAAHQGALQASIGSTIAIAACGLDHVYPASHRKLAEQISQQGLLISEFPIGTLPKPGHFPKRNRIISGLSLGVLVIEASIKSGSLITARLAMDQYREVFAIPGSINSPLSKGTHALLKNGAKLVETVEDVLEELKPCISLDELRKEPPITHNYESPTNNDPQHQMVLESMGYEPISIDSLVNKCGLSVEVVSSILLILELNGQVLHNGNSVYVRV